MSPSIDKDMPIRSASLFQVVRQPSTLARWLRIAGLAVLNVLLLAVLAAYFSNQQLDLISALSIIADSMGIVIGLLGIWFFFQSEQLNRESIINLQRTETTVLDLRNQMWDMIDKTFTTFMRREDTIDSQEVDDALELVREELAKIGEGTPSLQYLEAALRTISRRLEQLESRSELRTRDIPPRYSSSGGLLPTIIEIFRKRNTWPSTELRNQFRKARIQPQQWGFGNYTEILQGLVSDGYLREARILGDSPSAPVYVPGPFLEDFVAVSSSEHSEPGDS